MKKAVAEYNILVVEDDALSKSALVEMIRSFPDIRVSFKFAENLRTAESLMKGNRFGLILLDLNLPDSEGLATLRAISAIERVVPIIVITGSYDDSLGLAAIEDGAEDYLVKGFFDRDSLMRAIRYSVGRKNVERELLVERSKSSQYLDVVEVLIMAMTPTGTVSMINRYGAKILGYPREEIVGKSWFDNFIPADMRKEIRKVFSDVIEGEDTLKEYHENVVLTKKGQKKMISWHNTVLRDEKKGIRGVLSSGIDITENKRIERLRDLAVLKNQDMLQQTVGSLARALEQRDLYTAGHQKRVSELALAIAVKMGLSENSLKALNMASVLHDIGKIQIPSEILTAPRRLDDIEFELIKRHPGTGYDLLKDIDFPFPVAGIVLQHHERINGSGYPEGLKGKDICTEALILGVADVVEAMASHRPYRRALGLKKAIEEIIANRGKLYDPSVVDTCVDVFGSKEFKFKKRFNSR